MQGQPDDHVPSAQRPGEVVPAGEDAGRPPPSGPPRLRRSKRDRVLAGVAGGIAHHLGLDPVVVRVVWVVLVLLGFGAGLILYLVAWLVMPEEVDGEPSPPRAGDGQTGRLLLGGVLVAAGVLLLVQRWIPRLFDFDLLGPLVVVAIGVALLAEGLRR